MFVDVLSLHGWVGGLGGDLMGFGWVDAELAICLELVVDWNW